MSVTRVWCSLVDGNFEFLVGGPFPVDIPSNASVYELQEGIKKMVNRLKEFDAEELVVWRCKEPNLFAAVNGRLGELIQGVDFSDKNKAVEIGPTEKVKSLKLSDIEILLVQVPIPLRARDNYKHVLDSDFVKEYKDIFIKVNRWGNLDKSDILRNNVRDMDMELSVDSPLVPHFVTELEGKLISKPGLAPEAHPVFDFIRDPQCRTAYFGTDKITTSELRSHEGKELPWRDAEPPEVLHIVDIASEPWETCWQGSLGKSLDEDLANVIFFFKLRFHLPKGGMTTAQLGDTLWPFELVMECNNEHSYTERFRSHKPRSDFLVLKSTLPRLLIAVNSVAPTQWPQDLIRMLLEGAAIVRFANRFLDAFKLKKNFVLVAIYIREQGEVNRFTLFQKENDPAVSFCKNTLFLNTPVGRVEFALQLYNLIHVLGGDNEEEHNDTKAKTWQLTQKLSEYRGVFPMKSFYTDDTQGPKRKRARTDEGGGDGTGTGVGAGGVGAIERSELRAHGYEVEPEPEDIVMDDGTVMEPLYEKPSKPSHILTVYRSSDPSKKFIAKKVRKNSNELGILKSIGVIQAKPQHVIPLLDSFPGQSGPWAILPKIPGSVQGCLTYTPGQLRHVVARVCWGLIKGLAFLHNLCIAHRDIKPDNLLVERNFCLKIIDFDIAIQVKNEDEEVSDHCGTKGWLPPEVENKLPMYSPIKADRWSCGHVILHILDKVECVRFEREPLKAAAKDLEADDPGQRPSLLEWHTWTDAPPSANPLGQKQLVREGNKLVLVIGPVRRDVRELGAGADHHF